MLTFSAIFQHVLRIYINLTSWLRAPVKLDWSKQIVLITGGEPFLLRCDIYGNADLQGGSGIGALLAETLAMRNVTTVVLSKDPVVVDTNNGKLLPTVLNA